MKILVTGANGQLGNEIRVATPNSVHEYLFTDVAELDITDAVAVRNMVKNEQVDVVVNCAAYTAVERAEDDEVLADKLNHLAAKNLAEACKAVDAVLIQISTDYVFNGESNVPYREECATDPIGVYGVTKLAGEQAVEQSGCRFLIFRTSWLYSSFGNNFVKTMRKLTSERETLNVVFDQVGTPTYAGDLAEFIVRIIESGQYATNTGVYHYSNEGVCSWYDFAVKINALSGHLCLISPCHSDEFPSKVTRPNYSVLDKAKVKRDFGIRIPYWEESLVICIDKFKKLI